MKKKGSITGSRYRDRVELFEDVSTDTGLGGSTINRVSKGLYDADVEILSGGKALQYQSFGFTNPVIVKMRAVSANFTHIGHNDNIIVVQSAVSDTNNRDNIIITGNYGEAGDNFRGSGA